MLFYIVHQQVMFWGAFVCVNDNSKSEEWIFLKFVMWV